MLKQEIDKLREEAKENEAYYVTAQDEMEEEIKVLEAEKNRLNSLLKALSLELAEVKGEITSITNEKNRILQELSLANEIISQNQKSLDTSGVTKNYNSEGKTAGFESQNKKLEKNLLSVQTMLEDEKKKHQESIRELLEADKKIEFLSKEVSEMKEKFKEKDEEAEGYANKMRLIGVKFEEMKLSQKSQLEYYEKMISQMEDTEKENLDNLKKLQEYEKVIDDLEEKQEINAATIDELHEIINEYKTEVPKYEEKIKTLEEKVGKISKDVSQSIEFKNFQNLSKTLEKPPELEESLLYKKKNYKKLSEDSGTKDLCVYEDLSEKQDMTLAKSFEVSNGKLSYLLNELESLEKVQKTENTSQKIEIIQKIRRECEENVVILMNSLNFEELYEGLIKEFEDYKDVTQDLEKKLDFLTTANKNLQETLRRLEEENQQLQQKINAFETVPKFDKNDDDIVGFDSLSLDKQVSYIYAEGDYMEKIKLLEDENSRLRVELEGLKLGYSSLQYSSSEDENLSKKPFANEEIDDTCFNKTNEVLIAIPPRPKKLTTSPNDNILILDNGVSSSSDNELPSPEVEMSTEELEFESK